MPDGFAIFGTRDGQEEQLYFSARRDVVDQVLALGHFQSQGYENLEVREDNGENSPHAQSLQMARENAIKGLPEKRRRQQQALARKAMLGEEARLVTWGELKRQLEERGLQDGDPIDSIHWQSPFSQDAERLTFGADADVTELPVKVEVDDLGIARIN